MREQLHCYNHRSMIIGLCFSRGKTPEFMNSEHMYTMESKVIRITTVNITHSFSQSFTH